MGTIEYLEIQELKAMLIEVVEWKRSMEKKKPKRRKRAEPTEAQLEARRKFAEMQKKKAAARKAAERKELEPPSPDDGDEFTEDDLFQELS